MEPNRDIGPPATGEIRPVPRSRDHDAGGRKDHGAPYVKLEPEMVDVLKQMAEGIKSCQRRITASEDGSNMRAFPDLMEQEFLEQELLEVQWGHELRKYLTGKALVHWLYMRRTGTPLADWPLVRQHLCARFCNMSRDRMMERMGWNVWRGDHVDYSSRFADIVTQGETLPADELLGYYLGNLPAELLRTLTQGGTRIFRDWQDAATALSSLETPWQASCVRWQQFEQELVSARHRTGPGGRSSSPRLAPAWRSNLTDENTSARCYECRGKGHLGRDYVKGDERARQRKPTGGSVCLVATGPNAISVSPNRRQRLLPEGKLNTPEGDIGRTPRAAEGTGAPSQTEDERTGNDQGGIGNPAWKPKQKASQQEAPQPLEEGGAANLPWWHEGSAPEHTHEYYGSLCGTGKTAVLQLEIVGHECEGLLDTGASRSFIRPAAVERLGLRVRILPEACSFTVANGEVLHIDRTVPRLSMHCGGECFTGDFLGGPIPYEIILGIDWLVNHKVAWYFQSDKLRTYVNGRWCDLPVPRKELKPPTDAPATTEPAKTPADRAYDALAHQVARMTAGEAAAFLRPPPKLYKSWHRAGDRVKIKDVLREERKDTAARERALEGLHFVAVLPEAEPDRVVHVPLERQGPLLCAIVEHYQATTREPDAKSAAVAEPAADDTGDSPWPTAKLTYTEFDNWSWGHEALRLPPQILTVLQQHRLLFPDSLPDGLPPKRPYDHRILLLPGKLPTKSPIYKMPPDHLSYHTKEIARLTAKGWIEPTYSPICGPTIMVVKRDDGSGERKMRMVVNYQALNTLTIAPEFPMPTVHTILEMLGGAKYFSTLDLEAGFHQIRMAKEDRWKTAFRSVQGLFEYKVMPFGLKGAPATFQANINAHLQPLLGHGVIAYLDDVLIYSPSLDTHASLLQQVLSIFLTHQFYPRLSKCKFAR
ncbi:OSJNBa0079C19.6 protein, related [Eimeria brunetti]|uniref:OSJNBa0079C19.6 protein, related n=1 Tax=Eimeria brunetti TaxID=51314 RepID=U6LNG3_9EIME|nr:OSJNBa0079C19.6 protein, related [Eimeria brunetti]